MSPAKRHRRKLRPATKPQTKRKRAARDSVSPKAARKPVRGKAHRPLAQSPVRKSAPRSSVRTQQAPQDTRRLLHELEVQRTELELQNEELRRAREQLERSQQHYFDLYDLAPIGYCTVSQSGILRQANFSASGLLGRDRAALHQQPFCRFVATADHDRCCKFFNELPDNGEPRSLDLRMVTGDATPLDVHLTATTGADAKGQVVHRIVLSDVTEKKLTEAALRDNEFRWRTAIDGTGDGLWDWDVPANRVFFSRRWKEMLGFADHEIGDGLAEWETRVHPQDKAETQADIEAHLTGLTPVYINEHRVSCKDGSWKWILDRGVVVDRDAAGKPLRMIGTHHDITERKHALAALQNSEARCRLILDANAIGILFWDSSANITQANEAFLKIVGYTQADVRAGKVNWIDMSPPESREADEMAMREIMTKGVCTPFEKEYFRKDGSRVPVLVGGATFPNLPINGVAFVLDITDRKQMEAALRTAAKVSATGRLAAGIAHEINNPLAGIRSAFEVVKAAMPADHPDIRFAGMIEREIERISRIVGQMFNLYKPETEPPRTVELNNVLNDVVELSRGKARAKGVELILELAPAGFTVFHPPGALSQVLLNLMNNALQVAPSGTGVRLGVVVTPERVTIALADQGPGIPEAVRERVFEPFYTTKANQPNAGMGLGLSVSRSLVEMMGGRLEFVGPETGGTIFHIHLPLRFVPGSKALPI